jgi:hypothetical protein
VLSGQVEQVCQRDAPFEQPEAGMRSGDVFFGVARLAGHTGGDEQSFGLQGLQQCQRHGGEVGQLVE